MNQNFSTLPGDMKLVCQWHGPPHQADSWTTVEAFFLGEVKKATHLVRVLSERTKQRRWHDRCAHR